MVMSCALALQEAAGALGVELGERAVDVLRAGEGRAQGLLERARLVGSPFEEGAGDGFDALRVEGEAGGGLRQFQRHLRDAIILPADRRDYPNPDYIKQARTVRQWAA